MNSDESFPQCTALHPSTSASNRKILAGAFRHSYTLPSVPPSNKKIMVGSFRHTFNPRIRSESSQAADIKDQVPSEVDLHISEESNAASEDFPTPTLQGQAALNSTDAICDCRALKQERRGLLRSISMSEQPMDEPTGSRRPLRLSSGRQRPSSPLLSSPIGGGDVSAVAFPLQLDEELISTPDKTTTIAVGERRKMSRSVSMPLSAPPGEPNSIEPAYSMEPAHDRRPSRLAADNVRRRPSSPLPPASAARPSSPLVAPTGFGLADGSPTSASGAQGPLAACGALPDRAFANLSPPFCTPVPRGSAAQPQNSAHSLQPPPPPLVCEVAECPAKAASGGTPRGRSPEWRLRRPAPLASVGEPLVAGGSGGGWEGNGSASPPPRAAGNPRSPSTAAGDWTRPSPRIRPCSPMVVPPGCKAAHSPPSPTLPAIGAEGERPALLAPR